MNMLSRFRAGGDGPPRVASGRYPIVTNEPLPLVRLLVLDASDRAALKLDTLLMQSIAGRWEQESAPSLDAALEALDRQRFHVILICGDPTEPTMRATCARLRATAPAIPAIVLGDEDDELRSLAAFDMGAADYLVTASLSVGVLSRALRHAIEHHRTVTELRYARERERRRATHDALTGLPNRALFSDRLGQALAYAERYGQQCAVLYIDLDDFKRVNDEHGHAAGDQLLAEIARRLTTRLRQSDTVARLGGDEFAAVLVNLRRPADAGAVAESLLEEVSAPFELDGGRLGATQVEVSPSIGVSLYPTDGANADTLLKNADAAMYAAKRGGRHAYRYYQVGMRDAAVDQMTIERQLLRALRHDELALHYQPQVDVSRDMVFGAEALIRWPLENGEMRMPDDFLPIAEESGLIVEIGEWVLRTACLEAARWAREGRPDMRVAVNLSTLR